MSLLLVLSVAANLLLIGYIRYLSDSSIVTEGIISALKREIDWNKDETAYYKCMYAAEKEGHKITRSKLKT